MNRRTFLLHTAGWAAAGLAARRFLRAQSSTPSASSGQAPSTSPGGATKKRRRPAAARPPITEFKPLRRNTGLFKRAGGTIGWLASPDALVVIDTQFPDTAAACLAGLPGRGSRNGRRRLNTHHHFDHTSGNPIFKPASKTIVAQANVPKLQFAAAEKAGSSRSRCLPTARLPRRGGTTAATRLSLRNISVRPTPAGTRS